VGNILSLPKGGSLNDIKRGYIYENVSNKITFKKNSTYSSYYTMYMESFLNSSHTPVGMLDITNTKG
jgi:hypothetical protein